MMKLGVLSDTHDNLSAIEKAVTALNKAGADLVIHLGDYCAPFSLRPLKGLEMDWMGVFGNNDGEIHGLLEASEG
jgi:putative phosphoesterase